MVDRGSASFRPALWASLPLCSFLVLLSAKVPLIYLFALSVVLAAFLVVLRPTPAYTRLLALLIGSLLGLFAAYSFERSTTSLGMGMDLGLIRGVEGYALADPVPSRSGYSIVKLDIARCIGEDGLSARASFPLTLIAKGNTSIAWGDLVRVAKAPQPGREGGWVVFAENALSSGREGEVSIVKQGSSLLGLRALTRDALFATFEPLSERSKGLMEALLFGSREDIDQRIVDAFKGSGCVHILALSGMHLSIIAGILAFFLKPLVGMRSALWIGLLVVIGYIVIVGPQPSLVRSGVVYILYAIAFALRRRKDPLDILALSFLIICSVDPASFFSLSLQLSYLAMIGMLVIAPRLCLLFGGRIPNVLLSPLAISIGASFVTAPLLIFTFGAFAPIGILATLIVSPLVTLLIWLGAAWLFLATIPAFAAIEPILALFRALFDLLYDAMFFVLDFCARVPQVPASDPIGRVAICTGLVGIGVLVYACYRNDGFPRLRFPKRPEKIARNPRLYDAEKIRPEFSHQSKGEGKDALAS